MGGGGGAAGLGCQISDLPPSVIIADFDAVDGGVPVIPIGGTFVYPYPGGPTAFVANGAWHITASTFGMAFAQYWGVGIYFIGNPAGTDCIDATQYTGIQFDIAGTVAGTGCSTQYATSDSAHVSSLTDPKGAGDVTSYPPQAPLTVTATVQRIMMPFTGTGAPQGGNPAIGVDRSKLIGMQWQFTTAAGTVNSCLVDVTIDNVRFY
jgi:hypothetical protein